MSTSSPLISENSPYDYPVEECQVEDIESLRQFREFRIKILDILEKDDLSLSTQLYRIVWENRVFNIINETWGVTHKYDTPTASQNSLLCDFLREGYISSQVIGIRKLTDLEYKDPKKQINSIPRLLAEVKASLHLFTRENFVCYNGLPYNYEAAKEKHNIFIVSQLQKGVRTVSGAMKGPDAWNSSQRAHEAFDKLSHTVPEQRQRTDRICPNILKILDKVLENIQPDIDEIRSKANKFVAHSADRYSRESANVTISGFTFNQIDRLHKNFFLIMNFIASEILYDSYIPSLEVAQYDVLKGLDGPWIKNEDLQHLEKAWNERDNIVDNWEQEYKEFSTNLISQHQTTKPL